LCALVPKELWERFDERNKQVVIFSKVEALAKYTMEQSVEKIGQTISITLCHYVRNLIEIQQIN